MLVLGVVFLIFVQGFSVVWMGYWEPWLLVILAAVLCYFSRRRTAVSAGAGWLQRHNGRWVRTHELTRVTAHPGIGAIRLCLVDRGGRRIRIRHHDLQEDSQVWDLVYAGIVHSVIAGGARTNGLLHRAFTVPRPGG